jgi:hypothetical protein
VKDGSILQRVVNEGPGFLVEHLLGREIDDELVDEDMFGYD